MKDEDIVKGMKVVPFRKSYDGVYMAKDTKARLDAEPHWNNVKDTARPYLYVGNVYHSSSCGGPDDIVYYALEQEKGDSGNFFLAKDFVPYVEPKPAKPAFVKSATIKAIVKNIENGASVVDDGISDIFSSYMREYIGKTLEFKQMEHPKWYSYEGYEFHESWLDFEMREFKIGDKVVPHSKLGESLRGTVYKRMQKKGQKFLYITLIEKGFGGEVVLNDTTVKTGDYYRYSDFVLYEEPKLQQLRRDHWNEQFLIEIDEDAKTVTLTYKNGDKFQAVCKEGDVWDKRVGVAVALMKAEFDEGVISEKIGKAEASAPLLSKKTIAKLTTTGSTRGCGA
jgi:hypothetical protein